MSNLLDILGRFCFLRHEVADNLDIIKPKEPVFLMFKVISELFFECLA